jgi:hypothetical protein
MTALTSRGPLDVSVRNSREGTYSTNMNLPYPVGAYRAEPAEPQ